MFNVKLQQNRYLNSKVKCIHRFVVLMYPVSVIHIPAMHQSIISLNVADQLKPVSTYTFFTFPNY